MFTKVGRPIYVEVDLDSVANNVEILRSCCVNKSVGVIGVIKAGAYGHGSVHVGRHLKAIGVERLAVATIDEGMQLRRHGIEGPIHIFGNAQAWEMPSCVEHKLIPTVSSEDAIVGMAGALKDYYHDKSGGEHHENGWMTNNREDPARGTMHIKVDTGMCRNGCQPADLPTLIDKCQELHLSLEGVFTHFADSWDNLEFTRQQLDTFMECIEPYRDSKLLFHAANSGAVLHGIATDLDFIRPGIALYGLPPGDATQKFQSFGLVPVACIKGQPTLVKLLPAGSKIGYGLTYSTAGEEWIATFPVGYADGYWRHLSTAWFVVRDLTGEKCPVVGRVSMDAITVRLPCEPGSGETFTMMTADYDPHSSATGVASRVETIAYEVVTRLSVRYPRLYSKADNCTIIHALQPDSY